MNKKQRAAYYEGRNRFRANEPNDGTATTVPRQVEAINTQQDDATIPADDASRLTSASAAFGRNSDGASRHLNDRRGIGAIESSNRRICPLIIPWLLYLAIIAFSAALRLIPEPTLHVQRLLSFY